MKVLHVYKSYFSEDIGGVAQVINQLIKGVESFDIQSEVLVLSPKPNPETIKINNYKVHRCLANFEIASTPFSISIFKRFRLLAKQADIIHYHFPYPLADLLHLMSGIKKPTLITYHSDIIKQKFLLKAYKMLMAKFLTSVDSIVATSENYVKSSNILNAYKSKTQIIPIGLEKNLYAKATPTKLNYWQNKVGSKFFLFIGVLRYYKGLHILLEAAQQIEYPIVIAGSGPMEKSLKEQAVKLSLKNVHFLGFISDEDKVALLSLSYAIVFPSHLRSEAFGISLLEGAMYGKPLISTEIGTGTSYINKNQQTGLVIAPENPIELKQAMQYLWDNAKVSSQMGESAQNRYEELFTAKIMAKSYADLYRRLVSDAR